MTNNKKLYVILIIDYRHNGNITLYNKVFETEEAAKLEINHLAAKYIETHSTKNKKNYLKFREDTSLIYGGPCESCVFAEILYQIQALTLQKSI